MCCKQELERLALLGKVIKCDEIIEALAVSCPNMPMKPTQRCQVLDHSEHLTDGTHMHPRVFPLVARPLEVAMP